jgi:serine/threonine-protein kinase
MALSAGTRLGPYEVTAPIGAGGMGEVYRAIDKDLKRAVAIKVLPESVAADAERLARFQREAEVLASLNHPHIAAIYGVERSAGTIALVMELVEGPTLADRIAQEPLPVDEALPIARQIAEALEAAHEQGIVHRDLKPSNIKVRPDGAVKVLDFGLAKAMEPPAGSSPSVSQSPTITTPAMMTQAGLILGTAAYMAPEQAKGRVADKRSDIWAFGCVLYEMLTSTRPFDGEDVSDTIANVLKTDPDWSSLPSETPPAIRTLLQSCLAKDRARRLAHISTALFVLEKGASLAPPADMVSAASLSRRAPWQRVAVLTAGALVVATVAGTIVWMTMRRPDPASPRVLRLPLATADETALTLGPDRDLAIAPDGSRLVYVGNRGTQLLVRAVDALEPVPVFTGTPRGVFVSPDSQWIGFGDGDGLLRRVAMTGGPAVVLMPVDGAPRGATWGPDDTIIIATGNPGTGLQQVAAAGGAATVLTRPDRAQGEADHLWPEMLPDSRAVLFTVTALTGGLDAAQVAVLDLETATQKVLVRGGSHAQYVPSSRGSPTGHLIYAAAGALRAVPFDSGRLETRGTSVPVVPEVQMKLGGGVDAVVAGDGTLAYVSSGGRAPMGEPHTLVWVDRQGRETPIPGAPPRAYQAPRLSPDGTRIAMHLDRPESDLWLWDLARETLTKVTSEPGFDANPLWMPDSRRLLFRSDRVGASNLFVQNADGTGSATRLTTGDLEQSPNAITADGMLIVFDELQVGRQRNLRLLTLTPTPRVEPLLETPFNEGGATLSPDGHWLAYQTNSSGRNEISVRPFPNVGDGQWQVSNAGGVQPRWARSGRELFYRAPDGALMAVPVNPGGTTWSAGIPTKLFEGRYHTGDTMTSYDVSPDGQRVLMLKEGGAADQAAGLATIILVLNWREELKRLAPTN